MDTEEIRSNQIRDGVADIVRRIWARDYSIWTEPSPGGGGDWMGWLDLPDSMSGGVGFAQSDQIAAMSGVASLNVLGMGGSSLTPEVLSNLFSDSEPTLNVFDTVNPVSITHALNTIDLNTAAFAVASKSGTTAEPLALESVFRSALVDAGIADPSDRFIAISDRGTPLAQRAADGEFAFHIETPADVGGRFSALSGFGMFPSSICGMPTDEMTQSATAMARRCQVEDNSNPGVELGLFMAGNALRGRDKVTFAISPSLQRFGLWLEQLLAESTGKNRRGLVPIAGEPQLPSTSYSDDRQFIRIVLDGESAAFDHEIDSHPIFEIQVPSLPDIAGEFFRWEFATAVAACAIGVYPFDQPDVEAAKQLARRALESDNGDAITAISINDAMDSVVANAQPSDYVAIVAFLPESDALTDAVSDLRAAISGSKGVATTFGYGPRYLHSTGQLHKGGPDSVILLALTAESDIDIDVPGQSFTLGQLMTAQAQGDVQACRNLGRRAELIRMSSDPIGEIESVAKSLYRGA